ncbi:hypothetical protein LOK49_LG02G01673 [Camellia lanceoleosa]|uniref:Uncharacterized protein n=1 Tax=Camellia lanceoleosa TaxID=1840588 RepID=A0ACC0IU20_9ERIC|nr:hypothetical protein LOK49_LG02G01673 [Camellia lanceoleosa]
MLVQCNTGINNPALAQQDRSTEYITVEPLIVPPTPRNPLRLLNRLPQHLSRHGLQPRIAKLRHAAVCRQGAKINSSCHRQPIILSQFLDIAVNTHTHKSVDRVVEEVDEGLWDFRGVEELEDKASAAHAELESGGGVITVTVVGSPLDVEADDEAVEEATMDGCDFGDPGVNKEGRPSDECFDSIGEKGYVVEVVGVVR